MKSGIGDQLDSTDRHIVDEHVHLNQTDNIVSSTITMPATTFNNNNNEFSYNHYGQQEDIAIKSDVNPLIIYVVPPEDCSNDNNSNNDYNKRMRGSLRSKQQNGSQQQQFNQKMDNVLLQPTNSANNGYNNNIGDNNNTNKNSNSNIVINSSLPDNIRRTTRRLDRDSRSVDTSTSEVNSNDDADSIVSRLSMIVSEQEEMNNKFDSENTLEQFNYSNHKNNNTHYDTKGIRKISELSLATSNGNTMSLGTRPRSFTVNTVDNVCKNCSIASPASKETLARPPSDNNTMRPLQANDNSIENMLTITRSTWTLSEFDRIFPKVTSKERKRSTDMTPNSIPTNFCNFVNYEPNNNTANANRFHQVDLGIPDLHNSNNSSNNNSGNQQQISAIGKQPQSALTTDNKEQQLRNRSGTDSSQETIMSSNSCTAGDKSSRWARRNITRYVPSIEWLMNYEYKQWLFGDIMAGLVVASLNVSLCLAAGLLADVDAGVAFRSSIVNTFIYAIFCTSRHTSFGAYSIMALMASVTVQKAMNDEMVMIRLELGPSASMSKDEYELWRYKIMIFYTFLTGLVQLVGGLLGLGTIVASFMPEALCSSMLASTAIAMAVGQLANMCGLNYRNLYELQTGDPSQVLSSTFKWCRQLLLLFENLHLINYVCLALSLTSIILLFANNYVFQQRLEKIFKRKILIPFELLILVLSTVISYAWNLEKDHQVETSGPVLITFDLPTMPDLRLIQELWLDALVAGLISFTLTATLAKLLAQKLNYELDSNQELIACGLGNIAGGLFDALPASGTAIRSTTQVAVGGQTQLASMINCLVLVLLAQTCGELISPLPRCVMASILFYGFARIMAQTRDAFKYWRLCKVDFSIWLVGFVAILSVDLIYGFVVTFIYSILTILYRAQNRRAYLLGSIDSSDVYVPINKYPSAAKIEGIEIYQYCGSLHYACSELFEQKLRQQTGVKVKQIKKQLESMNNNIPAARKISQVTIDKHNQHKELNIPTHIILDFSMISFVDSSGVFTMKKIIEEYQSVNIIVLFASLATHVAATVRNEPGLWDVYHSRFYVTLSDAVHNALRQRSSAFV